MLSKVQSVDQRVRLGMRAVAHVRGNRRHVKVESTVKGPQGCSAVVDRIELFQIGVGAFASGRRATKILDVHSSTVSRLWLRKRTRVRTIPLSGLDLDSRISRTVVSRSSSSPG